MPTRLGQYDPVAAIVQDKPPSYQLIVGRAATVYAVVPEPMPVKGRKGFEIPPARRTLAPLTCQFHDTTLRPLPIGRPAK